MLKFDHKITNKFGIALTINKNHDLSPTHKIIKQIYRQTYLC